MKPVWNICKYSTACKYLYNFFRSWRITINNAKERHLRRIRWILNSVARTLAVPRTVKSSKKRTYTHRCDIILACFCRTLQKNIKINYSTENLRTWFDELKYKRLTKNVLIKCWQPIRLADLVNTTFHWCTFHHFRFFLRENFSFK